MKINTKKLFKIALQLVVLGLVIFAIGYATSKPEENNGYYQDDQTYLLSEVSRIEVNTDSPCVVVKSVAGDSIHFTWKAGDHVQYTEQLSGGKLSVKYYLKVNWMDSLFKSNLNGDSFVLEIELPESFAGDINIHTVSGSISMEDARALDELTLSSVSGSIDASDISARQDIGINTTSGSAKVNDIFAANDLDIKTVSGSLQLRNAEVNGECDLSTGSGSLEVASLITADALQMKTISGSLDVSQTDCGSDITLSTTSASIKLMDVTGESLTARSVSGTMDINNLKADRIDLKNTSGAVKGTIQGAQDEYNIAVKTVSGDRSIKNHTAGGQKSLKVDTVSGDIKLSFSDN